MPTPYYSWKPTSVIISAGYEGEDVNTIPANPTATATSATSGQSTFQCYYRDSSNEQNCCSTRVVVTGHDEWDVIGVDQYNVLFLQVHTVVDSIVRDDKVETCGTLPAYNPNHNWDYNIYVGRNADNKRLVVENSYIAGLGTLAQNIDLGNYTLRIAPGVGTSRSSLYVRNDATNYTDDPDPKYHDIFQMGIQFTNLLPAIYRPGEVWNGSTYLSHNRSTGARNLWTGAAWKECTTNSGPTGSNDAPTIWNGSRNQNMRLIGQQ